MAFKPQPLDFSSYKMKVIQDLGQVQSKANPNRFVRHALFECPICLTHFEARAVGAKAHSQTSCSKCTGTHNLSKHPLYAIWNGIRQRCYNPKRKDYFRYGGAGVTMFEDWIENPSLFISWCEENGWLPELVIDKDIKSNILGITPIYSPDTISFITATENAKAASAKKVTQFSLDGTILSIHDSCTEAALSLGKPKTAKSSIANCCRGITNTAFGFIWKFTN